MTGKIRAGIGGWTFAPWRGVFYPKGTRQADELNYASRKLTAIEINGTYYSSQKPETFAKWAADTPDDFMFSVKASRFCTNRRVLAEAGESIERFFSQGIGELGDRLGPILWQFMATKQFAREDFAAFLDLLPRALDGRALRHCVEVRHDSFRDDAFVDLCRDHGVAICVADHETYPAIETMTADFVYARLMTGSDDIDTCYSAGDIDAWATRFEAFAGAGRDVFAYFISSGKVRAPAGAMALIERLRRGAPPAG
jgi:uncharacterized protein YecE (DUF72 family)